MTTGINRDRARGKSKGRGTGDDITQSTTDDANRSNAQQPSEKRSKKQGRPQTIEHPHRTTMTLEERQVDHLDRICAEIKLAGGDNLSRSNVVRALLDALAESTLDYSEVRSEGQLRQAFQKLLREH